MSLSSRVAKIFRHAWHRYGEPTMTTVPPLSAWTLPAGYSASASHDGIETTGGQTITDLDDLAGYYATGTVHIVPTGRTADLDAMVAAGVAPSGMIDVLIMQSDYATVDAAFAVEVLGKWYDVIEVSQAPVGHGTGIWARVRLQRRS